MKIRSALLSVLALLPAALSAAGPTDLRFSFGPQPVPGYTQVKAADVYNVNRTYGFDLGSKVAFVERGAADPLAAGFVTGEDNRPFFFSTRLEPGAYRVTVTFGDAAAASVATVKSETRRLMLEAVRVPAGGSRAFTFLVHVRDPRIPGGGGEARSSSPRQRSPGRRMPSAQQIPRSIPARIDSCRRRRCAQRRLG